MHPDQAPAVSAQTTMKEYRKEYREKQREFLRPENRQWLRENIGEIVDIIVHPRPVDVKEYRGSEKQMRRAIEAFYANDGRAFDPAMKYPPSMIDNYGKDYALNARGIYYFNDFRPEFGFLLLHRKCGLLCDPKWGETDLVFPFAVYEAKGWSGDCREARRQACQAGACYLDMLDNLVRTPGPVGSAKTYQTKTSHKYQVFALTSFGAHWHLLVGYQRPRQMEEHAGKEGMSKSVYVFQRVWSSRVINERAAWELLSLVDQIHLWAITEFRTFVTEHLKPWHKFCDDNYLLDWKSVYDVKPELKRMRTCDMGTNLPLPSWVKLVNDPLQRKIQTRAQKSLARAIKKHRYRKGKERCEIEPTWHCVLDQCSSSMVTYTDAAFLDHLRDLHHCPEDEMAQIKRCVDELEEVAKDNEQREELDGGGRGVLAFPKKRCFTEGERLNESTSDSSSGCIPGPSKRVRVT